MISSLRRRCLQLFTPGAALGALLVTETILFLSEQRLWFRFNHMPGLTALIVVYCAVATLLVLLAWFLLSVFLRRRFQFSLRSLALLVTAIAVGLGWLSAEVRSARDEEIAAAEIVAEGGSVRANWTEDTWHRLLLGDHYFSRATMAKVVSERGLKRLPRLPQLLLLEVENVRLTDDDWAYLQQKSKIVSLSLSDASDEEVSKLARINSLDSLWLTGTEITDEGLKQLRTKPLWRLHISKTKVTDAGICELNPSRLWELDISETSIGDAGLKHLRRSTELRELRMPKTAVTDAGLENLCEMPYLTTLDLSDTSITGTGLRPVRVSSARASRVRLTVVASNSRFNDQGLSALAKLTQLESLDVSQTDITADGLLQLSKLPKLSVIFAKQTSVTPEDVPRLKAAMPKCHIRVD